MFLKKVIPCVIVALASASISGCVMADGGHHRGPSSDWHSHHESRQNRDNDNNWSHHAGPALPASQPCFSAYGTTASTWQCRSAYGAAI